jgi:hypothetical protein
MPYDQFVTWQLAGDLLPEATKEQMLASGFNRNHKITQEASNFSGTDLGVVNSSCSSIEELQLSLWAAVFSMMKRMVYTM